MWLEDTFLKVDIREWKADQLIIDYSQIQAFLDKVQVETTMWTKNALQLNDIRRSIETLIWEINVSHQTTYNSSQFNMSNILTSLNSISGVTSLIWMNKNPNELITIDQKAENDFFTKLIPSIYWKLNGLINTYNESTALLEAIKNISINSMELQTFFTKLESKNRAKQQWLLTAENTRESAEKALAEAKKELDRLTNISKLTTEQRTALFTDARKAIKDQWWTILQQNAGHWGIPLDDDRLRRDLEKAQANLKQAQANYDKLKIS